MYSLKNIHKVRKLEKRKTIAKCFQFSGLENYQGVFATICMPNISWKSSKMDDLEKIRVKRKAVDVKTLCTCLEDLKKLDSISWQDEKVYMYMLNYRKANKVSWSYFMIHLSLAQHCLVQHWFPTSCTVFNWFQKSSHSTVFSHFYHS